MDDQIGVLRSHREESCILHMKLISAAFVS